MKKEQSIKYIPMEQSYVRPGAGCGHDPDPEDVLYVHPTPVNPQPAKHSNTEEIDAVVQTGIELLSGAFWYGCLFIFKFFEFLPDNLDRARSEKK
ncbi:MAG: hypothetical protein ABSF21_07355 [Dehalococcoidia bacterium]